jgi:cellulose synthase/poly-beta-1,6-N-acetylglucosamine synthase-like glycosyltransferase
MSRISAVLSRLVVAFLATKLLTLLLNLWWFPVLRRGAPDSAAGQHGAPDDRPTLLLPMRNEADRLPGTLPRLFASGAGRLIFLDDRSTDGSAEVVRRAAAALPPGPGTPVVTVLDGSPRPEGWVGKTWACAQLADAAGGTDPMVFCDVDVELEPGALDAVLAEMRRQEADVFSVFPNQRRISWGERLLTPLIEDVLLCFLPFGLLRARARSARSAATACGALLVFRRVAYERLGGYAAVRSELVEDVAMARLSRRRGLQLGLALGGDEVRVRMYDGYPAVITGLGRGLTAAAGGRRSAVLAGYAWHLLAYTVPVLLLRRSPWWRGAALLAVAERTLVEVKTGGRDWAAAAAVAASPVAAAPVVARAMRREQQWRGRVYR